MERSRRTPWPPGHGSVTRLNSDEGEHRETLIRLQHDKVRAEDNARFLAGRSARQRCGSLRPVPGDRSHLLVLHTVLRSLGALQQFFHDRGQRLLPQHLVRLQHVSHSRDQGHLAGTLVADVDCCTLFFFFFYFFFFVFCLVYFIFFFLFFCLIFLTFFFVFLSCFFIIFLSYFFCLFFFFAFFFSNL